MTPPEIWVLKLTTGMGFVPPMDDDGTRGFMAWPSKEEADKGLAHQVHLGFLYPGDAIVERIC